MEPNVNKTCKRRDRARAEKECADGVYKVEGLKDVRTVLDIGAYHGSFSRYVANLYPDASIFAFEPNPESYGLLAGSVKGYNIAVHNVAVGGHTGVANFYAAIVPSCSSIVGVQKSPRRGFEDVLQVHVIGINDFISGMTTRTIDILKMDCEGGEVDILTSLEARYMKRIRYVTGEWHGWQARDVCHAALAKTHDVEIAETKPNYRGYFYGRLKA